jgi:hypothetical protein
VDSFVLYGPDGASPLQLASWINLGKGGVEFGADALWQPKIIETINAEGGYLSQEQSRPRTIALDLLVPSHSNWGGLTGAEALLRLNSRPGGYIDIQPEGVASAESTRFDIIHGRWSDDYDTYHQRVARRQGKLSLTVQPWGYWPTQIILASAASIGVLGSLEWTGASMIGDGPALLRICVRPTTPTQLAFGTWMTDYMALSLTHTPSQTIFLHPASWTNTAGGTLMANPQAPASQVLQQPLPQAGGWGFYTIYEVPSAIESSFRGRFRAYAYAFIGPSQALPWRMSIDTAPAGNWNQAMGSAHAIATIPPGVASGVTSVGGYGAHASRAPLVVDLGEITLPQSGSGVTTSQYIKWWLGPATTNVGVASPFIGFAGMKLLRVDSDYIGAVTRGLVTPTIGPQGASANGLDLDAIGVRALARNYSDTIEGGAIMADLQVHLRGRLPQAQNAVRLDWVVGARRASSTATAPVVAMPHFASMSVSYQPRFAFVRGI